MRADIARVIARLVQVIVALLSSWRRRQQSSKAAGRSEPEPQAAKLTAHQQRSAAKGGQNRRARRQQERDQAEEVFGLAMNTERYKHQQTESPSTLAAPLTEADAAPSLAPAAPEQDTRHRTMPFKVADMEQFTLTAESAFEHKYNNVMLTVQGRAVKRLRTDTIGARHQKFVLKLPSGQSILVTHNIDDAPNVPFRLGDELEVRGRYVWNEQGGEMHWTHHDPLGKVMGGYIILLRTGQRYEL